MTGRTCKHSLKARVMHTVSLGLVVYEAGCPCPACQRKERRRGERRRHFRTGPPSYDGIERRRIQDRRSLIESEHFD